jgi:CRISPR-associated protein Cmr1
MSMRPTTVPPKYESLKDKTRRRGVRGGPNLKEISVTIEVVTPIFGGGAFSREIDHVDTIRVPTVRGHLRFWWRALYGHEYHDDPRRLFNDEAKIWGRASVADATSGRSLVDLRIDAIKPVDDFDDGSPLDDRDSAYALWPARIPNSRIHLPRRKPGTRFKLTLLAPDSGIFSDQLQNTVRAWILFGGYGSRTRRGLGSLTVVEDRTVWLAECTKIESLSEGLTKLFSHDPFAGGIGGQAIPLLAGSALYVSRTTYDHAESAWKTALNWLKEFRQEPSSGARNRPAATAPHPERPSTSNWPEADSVRTLVTPPTPSPWRWAHTPRSSSVAFPRAGFGLPIVGQFQRNARSGGYLAHDKGAVREPPDFELRWRDGSGTAHDRLASPLILKALPLANGKFVSCALWLNREVPPNSQIVLNLKNGQSINTAIAFDAPYTAAPGAPAFIVDAGKHSLRQAFLSWLGKKPVVKVAP